MRWNEFPYATIAPITQTPVASSAPNNSINIERPTPGADLDDMRVGVGYASKGAVDE
ncbi:hypothetical protein [Nocardia sp. NBC_01009]|uniref:hypothetical protein n=1 Tax=Nocardia sp. NBC_01009 TaxID=2975996 RepID=UPI0038673047|nr:hypothetical protein OHA42_02395 [Nocardia sp. NBC_01009]